MTTQLRDSTGVLDIPKEYGAHLTEVDGEEAVILPGCDPIPVLGELHAGMTLADWDAINARVRAWHDLTQSS